MAKAWVSALCPPNNTDGSAQRHVGVIPAAIPHATRLIVPVRALSETGTSNQDTACSERANNRRGKKLAPAFMAKPVSNAKTKSTTTGI